MDAYSLHLCFQVSGDLINDQGLWDKIVSVTQETVASLATPVCVNTPTGDKVLLATGQDGSHCVVHVYPGGLVTMDVQYSSTSEIGKEIYYLSPAHVRIKALETQIETILGDSCTFKRSLPVPIKRGRVCPYFQDGDGALFEYLGAKLMHEVTSQWQNIKIYNTPEMGNILCLDDDIMISEADDIYTQTLLGIERNNFRNKTVLILGGGDGGLLHELLKHQPKHVTMVEIDMEVIQTCRQYLKRVCGDSLDQLSGPNHTIRLENCVKVLQEYINKGQMFDFVINDLSEFLIDTETGHDVDYDTSNKIMEWSVNLLEQGGKYLQRGDCLGNKETMKKILHDIKSTKLLYEMFVAHVPSFKEKYTFFEIWKPDQNGLP